MLSPRLSPPEVMQSHPEPPLQLQSAEPHSTMISSPTTGPHLIEEPILMPIWLPPEPMPNPGKQSENDELLSNSERPSWNEERGNRGERLKWQM
jgi:hypothetical protein